MNIKVNPKVILKFFMYIITFLLFMHILGLFSKYYLGDSSFFGLIPFFHFNYEKNIPTFYSAVALLISSVLLLFIAVTHKKENSPYFLWILLAIIFLFLSIDEISSIHENLTAPTRKLFNSSELLYFAWTIPYGFMLIVFVSAYLKFLINLPRNIMILFVISGAIFVTGAIGFEMLSGREFELNGKSLLYAFLATIEELLEMLGIAIFIYTLLKYIVIQFKFLKITVTELE